MSEKIIKTVKIFQFKHRSPSENKKKKNYDKILNDILNKEKNKKKKDVK